MNVRDRWTPVWRGLVAAGLLGLVGCGSDSNLSIDSTRQCGGGTGLQVKGVVRLPNGRLARHDDLLQRVASALVAPVEALSGNVSPVGKGLTVELIELRPEDVASGNEPGAVARTTTNAKGEYCLALAADTTVDVCRYAVRIGSRDDGTRTRAFVYATDEAIDIDYVSEATVQVILDGIPPADLCDFSPAEIAEIHQAVGEVPGTVSGATVAEVNALATTYAAADATVRGLVTQSGNLPSPTATLAPGAPTATRTRQPSPTAVLPTATATFNGPTRTPTQRPTRTPNGPTATAVPSRTNAPTRTNTAGATTATPTPTATPPAATATATVPAATATATRPTATLTPPAATPTFTATPMPGGPLGERVFTIREDSMFSGENPRVGFFTTGLAGRAVSQNFSPGPLLLVAGAPNANGIATLTLKEDAYFKINIPAGGTVLCIRLLASGSSGRIDCDGGTPFNISLTAAAGQNAPVPTPITGQGTDSGPGAAELTVMQSIAELTSFDAACDATVTYPTPSQYVYTTATYTATKGTRTLVKSGESFDCANWTMTDGPGMLVAGIVAYDTRAGGDSASATRLADK